MTQVNPFIPILLNETLGDYRLTESITSDGAFGLIFKAIDTVANREVAIKVLQPATSSPEDAFEFRREGQLLRELAKARGVVDIYASSETTITVHGPGNIPFPLPIKYHVLELAQGTLQDIAEHCDNISWAEKLQLWRGAVLGVHQMHLSSIAHRDLKTGNCLLFSRPKRQTDCKVADLGRSRNWKEPAAFMPEIYLRGRGDLRFAPPEFLLGQGREGAEAHRLADLYGLGSLLFELGVGVGLTQFVLNLDPSGVREIIQNANRGIEIEPSSLLTTYQEAFDFFSESLPVCIKTDAVRLLNRICNPCPSNRLPVSGTGKRGVRGSGLEWLIRRADIMVKKANQNASVRPKVAAVQGV